jgi:hypothetical protein
MAQLLRGRLRMTNARREPRPLAAKAPCPRLENPRGATVLVAALSLAAVGAGCGRAHPLTSSNADAGGPPSTTTALCAVTTTQKPPFAVTFRFRADGNAPVYVRTSCGSTSYVVSACASGFATPLGPLDFSSGICECGTPCSPVTGGSCLPDEGTAISPGASLDKPWTGIGVELGVANGSQCTNSAPLPAAKYRVAIRAYDNADDAAKGTGGWIATRDFELPAPDGVVDVPLGANAPETCETGAATRNCTGNEARDVACDLAQTVTFESQGGELAPSFETYTIEPPARFTATSTSNLGEPGPATKTCSTAIPRCSADARVVTTADVARALAAPSVASAFASPMALFGIQGTFSSVFVVRRPDGASFAIGDDCPPNDHSGCRPITTDLKALARVLSRLEGALINRSCPALGPH